MAWVVTGLVFLFLMLRFPAFGAFVLLAVAAVGVYFFAENQRQNAREEKASSADRVALLRFSGDERLFLDGYLSKVTGAVTNTSSTLTVKHFRMKVKVYDCPDLTKPGCTVIGEDEVDTYVVIPPKQKRSFDELASFSGLPKIAPGSWTWSYAMQGVWAE